MNVEQKQNLIDIAFEMIQRESTTTDFIIKYLHEALESEEAAGLLHEWDTRSNDVQGAQTIFKMKILIGEVVV